MAKKLSRLTTEISQKQTKYLTFSDKFLYIREELGLSQAELAEKIQVATATIGLIEQGKTKNPGAEIIGSVTRILGISPAWLLNGDGPMLTADVQAQKISPYEGTGNVIKNPLDENQVAKGSATFPQTPRAGGIDIVAIDPPYYRGNAKRIPIAEVNMRVFPYVPVEARAGIAEFYSDDLHKYPWEEAETIAVIDVPETDEFKEAIVVGIAGDSMDPTIKNGSKVLVTPVQRGNWQYLNAGVYCIIFLNNFVVKRVKDNTLMENGLLRLHSDNPAGGQFQIKGEDLRAVWRVRWAAYTPIE